MNEISIHTLSAAQHGDPRAVALLMDFAYQPLRALAGSYFRRQPSAHTLQPTALVHEVYLRIANQSELSIRDRAHFFAICATVMRGILTDHARKRSAGKRGRDRKRVTLSQPIAAREESAIDVLDLHELLKQLSELSERQARIVECRVFAGMTIAEIAEALQVSKRTIEGDGAMARAWMSVRMSERF